MSKKYIICQKPFGYAVRSRNSVSSYQMHPCLAQVFESLEQAQKAEFELKNNGFTEVKICEVIEGETE